MRASDAVMRGLRASLARMWLRDCDHVGRGVRLHGRPFVKNLGRIEIDVGLVFSSIPVRSHLVTGPEGIIRIGKHVRIAHGASISAHAELEIGDDVVIGPFVMLLDSDYHDTSQHDSPGVPRPIRIGNRVRLGPGVIVLRGAIIGDGAVIAPNSVVNRYVPGAVHAAGVPARPTTRIVP